MSPIYLGFCLFARTLAYLLSFAPLFLVHAQWLAKSRDVSSLFFINIYSLFFMDSKFQSISLRQISVNVCIINLFDFIIHFCHIYVSPFLYFYSVSHV